jgi:hypothetical protein
MSTMDVRTIDLRTMDVASSSGRDTDAPTGAAAAFALLAFMACSLGVVAGALLF